MNRDGKKVVRSVRLTEAEDARLTRATIALSVETGCVADRGILIRAALCKYLDELERE